MDSNIDELFKVVDSSNNENNKKKFSLFDTPNPDPIEINSDNVKIDKSITFAVDNKNDRLSDNDLLIIERVMKVFKDKGYKIRILCNTLHSEVEQIIYNLFDNNKIILVKPWKKLCDNVKDVNIWLPSENNIRAAVTYFKNFNKGSIGLKHSSASKLTMLFGPENDSVSEYLIIYDRYFDGKTMNFDKSRDSSTYLWFPLKYRKFTFNRYNIANKDDIRKLLELLR